MGGPFNPATLDSAEGFLATSDGNEDGCDVFHERFDGKVLLVKRGNCFFQVRLVKFFILFFSGTFESQRFGVKSDAFLST